jgi:hypothetical protein
MTRTQNYATPMVNALRFAHGVSRMLSRGMVWGARESLCEALLSISYRAAF